MSKVAGVTADEEFLATGRMLPAARPRRSLPGSRGLHRRFAPGIHWRLSPKAPLAPTLSPCAYAFRRRPASTAFLVDTTNAGISERRSCADAAASSSPGPIKAAVYPQARIPAAGASVASGGSLDRVYRVAPRERSTFQMQVPSRRDAEPRPVAGSTRSCRHHALERERARAVSPTASRSAANRDPRRERAAAQRRLGRNPAHLSGHARGEFPEHADGARPAHRAR